MPSIFDAVTDPRIQQLLRREREALVELRALLEQEHADEKRRIDDLLQNLDDFFALVVVGEFNSGKSSLINALFGQRLRKEGPVPVDDVISILRHGDPGTTRRLSDFVVEQTYPIDLLRDLTLVDTPGTNSIVARHQEITRDWIPRADLVLFVTSIDRPLSESERQFLDYIREWGKKIVFVLTKIDTKPVAELDEVLEWLRTNVRQIFGFDPAVFPVAARQALAAKLGEADPRAWTASRFEPLEDWIANTLTASERIRLKLEAPLDTARAILRQLRTRYDARRELLTGDITKIRAITAQLDRAKSDLTSNAQQFAVRIDNLMLELEKRGVDFLDRTMRLSQIVALREPSRFREEFERQVFSDWHGSIDRTIQESVDWLVRENQKLWRDTVEEFHRRADPERHEALIGKVGREFAWNREEVYSRIRTEAEARLRSYDVPIESRRTIDTAMRGVFQSLGLGAGALGLGYLVTTAFTSMAVDVTGLTAATMLLVTSFLILPYKRTKAKAEFRERIEVLRAQLRDAVERESAAEVERMVAHVASAFEPYIRFFETETAKIDAATTRLAKIDTLLAEVSAELQS